MFFCSPELSAKSAQVVVMTAFGAHFLKEVSRSQLTGAAKHLLPPIIKKTLVGGEKSAFIVPLAKAFLAENIVVVKKGANLSNLSREDVSKAGTF